MKSNSKAIINSLKPSSKQSLAVKKVIYNLESLIRQNEISGTPFGPTLVAACVEALKTITTLNEECNEYKFRLLMVMERTITHSPAFTKGSK